MFRLHETTERRVCRWAFVLLCATPTLAIAAWIVYGHRPWRLQDEQLRLGAALHADVRLTNWHEPRPGAVRTASVELADAAATAGFVTLAKLDHRTSGQAAWLTAETVALEVRQLPLLAARLHRWLTELEERETRFHCERLKLQDSESGVAETYHDVEAIVRRGQGAAYEVQLVARANSDAADAPRLRATLAFSPKGETSDGELHTATIDAAEAPLPLWLVGAFAPIGPGWGDDASLAGTIQLEFAGDQLRGTAKGSLTNLDLASVAAAGTYTAEGQARVELDELRWHDAHVERVAGVVHAENIRVSPSVITAATDQLFCGPLASGERSAAPTEGLVAVDAVSCRFVLDAGGLALTGAIPESAGLPAGCMAAAAGRPLLTTPRHPRLHPSTWVQFIAAGADGWVPGAREAIEAANRLPLPSVRRQASTTTDEDGAASQ